MPDPVDRVQEGKELAYLLPSEVRGSKRPKADADQSLTVSGRVWLMSDRYKDETDAYKRSRRFRVGFETAPFNHPPHWRKGAVACTHRP
ncbi:hypothetical protein llg_18850 [Luteolibacter sp. LG18]|nr:hypothetical protein llg_18850 [Luteolibacter sp. LG18]